MLKSLVLLINLFLLFNLPSFFVADQVSVTQTLPDSVAVGDEFKVEITINKNGFSGFAKFQQEIPYGFEVIPVETQNATFSFKDDKVKFIWMSLPTSSQFVISYLVKVTPDALGEQVMGGTFSYLEGDETRKVQMESKSIQVKASLAIATGEATANANNYSESSEGGGANKATAEGVQSQDGVASSDQTMQSDSQGIAAGAANAVEGQTNTAVAVEESTSVNVSQNQSIAGNGETTGGGEAAANTEGAGASAQSNTSDNGMTMTSESASANQFQATVATNIPAPQTGVAYRVQISASKKPAPDQYFVKRYRISEHINYETHQGWHKYTIGSFPVYKEARDYRNKTREAVKGAFVTAYNNGVRITVQEALMITRQKWVM